MKELAQDTRPVATVEGKYERRRKALARAIYYHYFQARCLLKALERLPHTTGSIGNNV